MASKGTSSGVLLAVAVALALQVPTSVAAIPDAVTRSMVQAFLLVIVIVCAILVKPREVATMVVNSLRPPPRQDAPDERVSIRPPPLLPFDVEDAPDELEERIRQRRDTPHETPAGRRPKR